MAAARPPGGYHRPQHRADSLYRHGRERKLQPRLRDSGGRYGAGDQFRPGAAIFEHADIGMVADWASCVPLLVKAFGDLLPNAR